MLLNNADFDEFLIEDNYKYGTCLATYRKLTKCNVVMCVARGGGVDLGIQTPLKYSKCYIINKLQ